MRAKWLRIGAEVPTEIDRCSYGYGPPGGNCILQCMKSNSRLFRKYFCVRKICFPFLGPLCILISFSGAAVVVMLLNSRACSHQIYSFIPSILSYVDFYKPLSSIDYKHPSGSAVKSTTVTCHMFVPLLQKRSTYSSFLFFTHLCTKVDKCCYMFTLKQAMKEMCLAMHQEIKRSVDRILFGSLVLGSEKGPSPGHRRSNAVTPIVPED